MIMQGAFIRRILAVIVGGLLLATLVWLGGHCDQLVLFVLALITGRESLGLFEPRYIEGVYRGFFLFGGFMVISIPYLFWIGWISRWASNSTRLFFTIVTPLLYFFPFCFLTIGFARLVQYMAAMGSTPKRLLGLLEGFSGYAILILLVGWLMRLLWRNKN